MKETYKKFCETNPDIPIFFKPWWLNIVCGGGKNWSAAVVAKGDNVQGIMPFFFKKKIGLKGCGMPPATPFLGYKIFYPDGQKYPSKISFEIKTISTLLEQLPKVHFFDQRFHPKSTNWLPFYWKKYRQSTRYFYILKNIGDTDMVFRGFEHHVRQAIRKGTKQLTVSEELSPTVLIALLKMTFSKQGLSLPYPTSMLEGIIKTSAHKNCGKLYVARDNKGEVHATRFIVRDREIVYNIFSANNHELQSSGAQSLLVWHAIQEASRDGASIFNFCGSMMPGIERFIRGFGGIQQPYLQISKEYTPLFYLIRCANDFRKQFLKTG